LEAATSRLEDLALANTNDFRESRAAQRSSGTPSLPKDQSPQFNTGVFTPELRNSMIEETIIEEEKPLVVANYEKVIKDFVEPWLAKSQKVGQVVAEQVWFSLVRIVDE
jgi:Adenylate cyclase associated (CAP) N terminal